MGQGLDVLSFMQSQHFCKTKNTLKISHKFVLNFSKNLVFDICKFPLWIFYALVDKESTNIH